MNPDTPPAQEPPLYERIYALVSQVPPGRVATYGLIAGYIGGISAQMVGFALAALPAGRDVPWQRIINAQGKVSPHGFGFGSAVQRDLLEAEGVSFDLEGRVDLARYGWSGPDGRWDWSTRRRG